MAGDNTAVKIAISKKYLKGFKKHGKIFKTEEVGVYIVSRSVIEALKRNNAPYAIIVILNRQQEKGDKK